MTLQWIFASSIYSFSYCHHNLKGFNQISTGKKFLLSPYNSKFQTLRWIYSKDKNKAKENLCLWMDIKGVTPIFVDYLSPKLITTRQNFHCFYTLIKNHKCLVEVLITQTHAMFLSYSLLDFLLLWINYGMISIIFYALNHFDQDLQFLPFSFQTLKA